MGHAPAVRRSPNRSCFLSTGLALVALLVSGRPVAGQTTYLYTGNTFDLFSCGGSLLCPVPDPTFTSYNTSDFVVATLTLDEPLAPDLVLENVRVLAGFSLVMNDGHQTLTLDPGVPGEAMVSTDANGNIIGPWSVFVNCCLFPNNNVFSLNWPGGRGVGDGGALSTPTGSFPNTPRDQGMTFGNPGTWVRVVTAPDELTEQLIDDIEDLIGTELRAGQANGLTSPLENALRSIAQGRIQPACSQLLDFIDEVLAKTPPLSQTTSDSLISEAEAIRSSLGCT